MALAGILMLAGAFSLLASSPAKDTTKVGILGNSFTYVFKTYDMLEAIARSQGHELVIKKSYKGGATFGNHLQMEKSIAVVNEGGYDFFLMQDQSTLEAKYADNPVGFEHVMKDARQLSDNIRAKSPSAIIILENTWAYSRVMDREKGTSYYGPYIGFGSFEAFDSKLSEGCRLLQTVCPNIDKVSPIGKAFAEYRAMYPDFYPSEKIDTLNSLYRKGDDSRSDHHQSPVGAYLKSCVNYLVIFGDFFDGEVDNCGIEPGKAALLRRIAEETVLGPRPLSSPADTVRVR